MPSALILDDDPYVGELLELELRQRLPGLTITRRTAPDPAGRFDLFVIDNQFGERSAAVELVRAARAANPEALIVGFSATLDVPVLKGLVAAGCDAVCEKGDACELHETLARVEDLLVGRLARTRRRGRPGALGAISSLLRSWNRRLELCEAEGAQ